VPPAPGPLFTQLPFDGVEATLAQLPRAAGVGQILASGARNLLIGRAANLRRWFATHLGAGRPPRKGARPPTDLSPLAATLAWAETTSVFHQRLLFERSMGEHVPLSARRDLKTPAFLHLDASERFPRASVRPAGAGSLYGPFRDRRAAQRALEALHKRLPLRPCDYSFEPDPALPLGLGCLYAQVRSCAAPCLARIGEAPYRDLAAQAARLLADPESRAELADAIPPWVSGARLGLVVERGRAGVELYPVSEGEVLDGRARTCAAQDLESTLAGLDWSPGQTSRDDRPWLSAWLHGPRKAGAYLPLVEGEDPAILARRVRRAAGFAPAA